MVYIKCYVAVFVIFISNLIQVVVLAPKINFDYSKKTYIKNVRSTIINYTRLDDKKGYLDKNSNNLENLRYSRFKRQVSSGAGKFAEAAKMPQIKTFRTFLQLFKNLWTDSPIGGSGPFHPDVPKPFIYLCKDHIIEFFFPEPGAEHKKKSH